MGAEIVENVHLAGGIPAEDEVTARDCASQERAALRQLGLVAEVKPAFLKDLLVLELEEFRIGEDLARNLEQSIGLVDSNASRRLDALLHVCLLTE